MNLARYAAANTELVLQLYAAHLPRGVMVQVVFRLGAIFQ